MSMNWIFIDIMEKTRRCDRHPAEPMLMKPIFIDMTEKSCRCDRHLAGLMAMNSIFVDMKAKTCRYHRHVAGFVPRSFLFMDTTAKRTKQGAATCRTLFAGVFCPLRDHSAFGIILRITILSSLRYSRASWLTSSSVIDLWSSMKFRAQSMRSGFSWDDSRTPPSQY